LLQKADSQEERPKASFLVQYKINAQKNWPPSGQIFVCIWEVLIAERLSKAHIIQTKVSAMKLGDGKKDPKELSDGQVVRLALRGNRFYSRVRGFQELVRRYPDLDAYFINTELCARIARCRQLGPVVREKAFLLVLRATTNWQSFIPETRFFSRILAKRQRQNEITALRESAKESGALMPAVPPRNSRKRTQRERWVRIS
jgi:hypothetical protein